VQNHSDPDNSIVSGELYIKAQNKAQSDCDLKVFCDRGSLALRFPVRHNALWTLLDGKAPSTRKFLALGKYDLNDNPEDWKRASQIAIAMESDLDHPEWEKLFDPTLAKYGIGSAKYAKLAEVLQMPGTKQPEPEMTVGAMWEDYLVWKQTQVEASTFKARYLGLYFNAIKGLKWDAKTKKFSDTGNGIWDKPLGTEVAKLALLIPLNKESKANVLGALSEAFLRAHSQDKIKLTVNPFSNLKQETKPDTRDKYKSVITINGEIWKWWEIRDAKCESALEADKRAFTVQERDIIIEAYYESDQECERQMAPLIEFLFLTGCRPGEAFALVWDNVKFENGFIWFNKSY
jgi:hypothetical protein